MKCEICKEKTNGKLKLKDPSILEETGEVKEWNLCGDCFNDWASQGYENLTRRLKQKNG